MVRIRLRRVGAKKQPHYRVVVADQRSPRDGRHIETIGHYNPRTEPETIVIKEDRALYWLSQGAQPSDVVLTMLQKQGTMDRLARMKQGESLEGLVSEYESDVVVQPGGELVADKAVRQVAEADAALLETDDEDVAETEDVELEAIETEDSGTEDSAPEE